MTNFKDYSMVDIARRFINSTHLNIFLTGKAGSGKTTFLRDIVANTHKKCVVAAPTGIAAINAGGVTLHSLFQLPFGCFIPDKNFNEFLPNMRFNNPHSLLKELRIMGSKRKLLQELELLVIDEVSMLRADILDAIDTVLQHVRRVKRPFGGLQVLFIGDLYQLPPVVKDSEMAYLKDYYKSLYFFSAKVLNTSPPITIELNKIHRQSDQKFIALLNNIRNNCLSDHEIKILNRCYSPNNWQTDDGKHITLTTHNHKAEEINRSALNKLPGSIHQFDAKISGDFLDHQFPVGMQLRLKQGAQVMFIRNDYSGKQRYFNGKIGEIKSIDDDEITVELNDGSPPILVEKHTWENKKYKLDQVTNIIVEDVVGEFTHYPLKLAWAITIHKSQGLTFENAIIDIEDVFAPGQVYVALSRLTSLEGLKLLSPFTRNTLQIDFALQEFTNRQMSVIELELLFQQESIKYLENTILESFNFKNIDQHLSYHINGYSKQEGKSNKQKYKPWALQLKADFSSIVDTGNKFLEEIKTIFHQPEEVMLPSLLQRIQAATQYFIPVFEKFATRTMDQIMILKKESQVKQYIKDVLEIELTFNQQIQKFKKAGVLIKARMENEEVDKHLMPTSNVKERKTKMEQLLKSYSTKEKIQRENTKEISFKLFKSGKSIEDIALARGLVPGTIEGHLTHYIAAGDLAISEVLSDFKYNSILKVYELVGGDNITPVKEKLGNEFTYGEIRMALAAIKNQQNA